MAHTKVTKAYSANTGAANTYSYSGSFDTFKATEVVVELDNVALTYTASTINESASPREYTVDYTNKTIHIGGADLSSGTIVIKPETDLGSPTPRATYTPGASITSADLNNNQKQLLRRAMEYEEQVMFKTGGTFTGTVEMGEDQVIKFEGATDDAYETTLTVTDPTADRTITLPNVTGTVVTTGDTATVTATMMAANSVDSSELVDGSVDNSHLADDAVNSDELASGAVDLDHMSVNSVGEHQYIDASIKSAHIANDQIDSQHYAAGSIDLEHMSSASVDSDNIVNDTIVNADINSSAAILFTKLENLDNTRILVGNGSNKAAEVAVSGDVTLTNAGVINIANGAVDHAHLAADAVDGDNIADDSINSEHYAAASIDNEHLADDAVGADELAANAVVNASVASGAAIDHAKLAAVSSGNVLVGNGSNQAASVAMSGDVAIAAGGATTIQANAVEIGMIGCEQTTISDSDSHIPTSGAVVDYVAAQIAPIGGLEVIADDESFPNTIAPAGVVISITDAAGLSVNSSGVSTNADALDNSTITINGFPSELRGGVGSNADPYVFGAGAGLMVKSTGSSQTYDYHQALIREADFVNLSDDINDFNNRYRISSGEPSGTDDEGDLYFDTGSNKMFVYDGSAWGEVTSTGDFKYLVLCVFNSGTGNAGVINGGVSKYDLRETNTSGSLASVTSAAQLMVSINGVVQKPNTGTAISSNDGFCMVDAHTIEFGGNIPSGAEVFVVQSGSALTINTPGDGTVSEAKIAVGAVSHTRLAADCVDGDNIQDDVINSEHYAAASVDHEHLANDCVDGDNLADNACDSEHYTDGSIDHVHLAGDCIDGDNLADNACDSEHYTDGSVDIVHLANGTDGQIITWNASGVATAVGPGSDGQVLTSTGAGSPPAFETIAAGITSDGDYNTAGGTNAGDSITSGEGQNNTSFGYNAGTAISTGDSNVAIGSQALKTGATCVGNVAVGWRALEDCQDGGEYNTSVGYFAGGDLTTGDNNVAIGASALDAAVTGGGNVAVGASSLSTNTSGANNTALGYQTLQLSTTASNNTAVGHGALYANTEGHSNVAIGNGAMGGNVLADWNVAVGKGAMEGTVASGASGNIAIGGNALDGANTAEHNIAIGYEALGLADTTGGRNIAIGNQSTENLTSGTDNVAIGVHTLEAASSANTNLAIGSYALEDMTDGTRNVALGYCAGQKCVTSDYSIYIGFEAGRDCNTNHNTFVGFNSGKDNADMGAGNTAVGSYTMAAATAGVCVENTCVGYAAGYNTTSGDWNTSIGYSAGYDITTGSGNILIGNQAGMSSSPHQVTTDSNRVVIGNNNITNSYIKVDWTTGSDERDKTDIQDISIGLNFVKQLKPKSFWFKTDRTSSPAVKTGPKKYGFLAQDILAVEGSDNVVIDDDDTTSLKYQGSHLIPILVNAIKELSTKNDALEARIAALEAG